MKKLLYIFILGLIFACGDDDSDDIVVDSEFYLQYRFDGEVFSYEGTTILNQTNKATAHLPFDNIPSATIISINAPEFSLLFANSLGNEVGSYPILNDPNSDIQTGTFQMIADSCSATSGTLNVSSYSNDIIEGTFSAQSDCATITNGQFRLQLIQ